MKTIFMLSALVALIAAAALYNRAWKEAPRITANECQVHQYACFRPAVSFASLH
ncbi:hypothetical protein D9M68_247890 [compost metagenome]